MRISELISRDYRTDGLNLEVEKGEAALGFFNSHIGLTVVCLTFVDNTLRTVDKPLMSFFIPR